MTHARTHARTHAHGANYDLPPASRAGDKMSKKGHSGGDLWSSYMG